MSKRRIIVKTILLLFLNICLSFLVFAIALFFNSNTYSGHDGFNIKLVCIIFQVIFLGAAILIFRKRDKEAFIAAIINLVTGILFFSLPIVC